MPNRYQKAQRQEIYDTIARYEGEYCLVCYCRGAGRRGPPSLNLEIDHAGPERHLVCKTHNLELRPLSLTDHISLMAEYSAENARAREKSGEWLPVVQRRVSYQEGSPEMQARSIIEKLWLEFMNNEIRSNGYVTKDEAIYGGANYSGGSASTTTRYLKTKACRDGIFREETMDGVRVIVYRRGQLPGNALKK